MATVNLLTATHIYAQPGLVTVSDAEASRLCSAGVAVPVEETEEKKKAAKKKSTK